MSVFSDWPRRHTVVALSFLAVILRYVDRANEFLIHRKDHRNHLSFGWGRHFCVGSRIADLQVRVLWEELLQRYEMVEVVGPPVRTRSSFVNGYSELPVQLHAK